MATVFLAHDLKYEREVAVKVLRPDLAAEVGAARFLREIQIAARLHHPHILPLYDSDQAGRPGLLRHALHRGRDRCGSASRASASCPSATRSRSRARWPTR